MALSSAEFKQAVGRKSNSANEEDQGILDITKVSMFLQLCHVSIIRILMQIYQDVQWHVTNFTATPYYCLL